MKNYMDALKRRKENGEAGFSLIELIVVVVILGVLAAIAVPVFLGLQDQAAQSAVDTAAANGASQVASDFAQDKGVEDVAAGLDASGGDFTLQLSPASTSIDEYCVIATKDDKSATSGPDCAGVVATPPTSGAGE